MRSSSNEPFAMPAAIRSASFCVLPDPAPASTRRLRSSSVTMQLRAVASATDRVLLMSRQPDERNQTLVSVFDFRASGCVLAACVTVVTPLARLTVRSVHEQTGRNDRAEIAQHGINLGHWLRRN